jgi:hypothetical protein
MPTELAVCSKGGLLSIMDVHCLLLSVAARLTSHQHAAAQARDKAGVERSQRARPPDGDHAAADDARANTGGSKRVHALGRNKAAAPPGLAKLTTWGVLRARHELEKLKERTKHEGRPQLTRPTISISPKSPSTAAPTLRPAARAA